MRNVALEPMVPQGRKSVRWEVEWRPQTHLARGPRCPFEAEASLLLQPFVTYVEFALCYSAEAQHVILLWMQLCRKCCYWFHSHCCRWIMGWGGKSTVVLPLRSHLRGRGCREVGTLMQLLGNGDRDSHVEDSNVAAQKMNNGITCHPAVQF